MPHYTSTSQDVFVERITFDFIGQIVQQMEKTEMSQSDLAKKLGVGDSDVSQVLNLNRINLNIKTMARYAHATGMKLAIVAYDDDDPNNDNGPVGSEIFNAAWEKAGKPRNIWSLNENLQCFSATRNSVNYGLDWKITNGGNISLTTIPTTATASTNVGTFIPDIPFKESYGKVSTLCPK